MRFGTTAFSLIALGHLQFSASYALAENLNTSDTLTFQLQVELAELKKNQPLQDLNATYREYLKEQKATYQQGGNLKAMLAVDDELEAFEEDITGELSTFPKLNQLQKIYRKQRTDLETELGQRKVALVQSYQKRARNLSVDLTRAGKIEEAKLALDLSERLVAMADLLEGTSIQILSAKYGARGKYADVTEKVKQYIEIEMRSFRVLRGPMGIDPIPGWNKSVRIRYMVNGKTFDRSWKRNAIVSPEVLLGHAEDNTKPPQSDARQ